MSAKIEANKKQNLCFPSKGGNYNCVRIILESLKKKEKNRVHKMNRKKETLVEKQIK